MEASRSTSGVRKNAAVSKAGASPQNIKNSLKNQGNNEIMKVVGPKSAGPARNVPAAFVTTAFTGMSNQNIAGILAIVSNGVTF